MKVSDLTADEAATRAEVAYNRSFQRRVSQRYLYHALTKDKNCPKALLVLTDLIGLEVDDAIAITIAEYAYNTVTDTDTRSRITLIRRIHLNTLKLITPPPEDSEDLPTDEFIKLWQYSPNFVEDREGIARLLKEVLAGRTLEQAYDAACLLTGVRSGLIVPVEHSDSETTFDDCFEPNNFRRCDNYAKILASEFFDVDD